MNDTNSVNPNVIRVRFHTDTKLHFKLPNGGTKEVFALKDLTYYLDVLPHIIKDHCHLKDWTDESICLDVPRSWFKLIIDEIY